MSHNDLQKIPVQELSGRLGTGAAFPWRAALPIGNVSSIPTGNLPKGNGTVELNHMEDRAQIWIENVRILEAKFPTKTAFAEKVEIPVGVIAKWFLKTKNYKPPSEASIRKIESKLRLHRYSLDEPLNPLTAMEQRRDEKGYWPFNCRPEDIELLNPRQLQTLNGLMDTLLKDFGIGLGKNASVIDVPIARKKAARR